MARSRKEPRYLDDVLIERMGAEGQCVAHIEEKVLFVPYAAPGDRCRIRVGRSKRSYMTGTIEELLEPSPLRVEPRCEVFGTCGGCKWQQLPYEEQLRGKAQQAADAMTRIGHIAIEETEPIVGCEDPWHYRNKVEFTFSKRRWLTEEELKSLPEEASEQELCGVGFHKAGMFDKVLDLHGVTCQIADPIASEIRDYLNDYCLARWEEYPYYDQRAHEGVMRTLLIRTTTLGGLMVLIAFAEGTEELRVQLLEALRVRFPQITSLYYMVNTKLNDSLADLPAQLYSGAPYIEEDMHGLRYRIGPKSFYQTNSRQAERLYEKVREYAQLTGDEVVYDLYTGAGTIANYLAQSCRSVIGIEYVPEAVEDAFVNRDQNGITNATFYAGDMKAILTDDFVAAHGRPDVLVTDPPRAGMDAPVVEVILRAAPQRIVYVSCNPATQARDLALLTAEGQYRAVRACAVDMFPHTHHVETVALLSKLNTEHHLDIEIGEDED